MVCDNICKCYEAFDNGKRAFMIIELMAKNITALLSGKGKKLNEKCVVYIMKETLKGLDFLH